MMEFPLELSLQIGVIVSFIVTLIIVVTTLFFIDKCFTRVVFNRIALCFFKVSLT